jgi:hypothetical protein
MKNKAIVDHSKFWLGNDFSVSKSLNTNSTMDLLKLSAYRRAISNFVYILTGKNIPVRFAEKSTSMTDGKVIYIGGELSRGEFDPTVGLALHEAMHIVKSDFGIIKTVWGKLPKSIITVAKGKITPDELGKYAKYVLNVVEDRYIDAWAYDMAPGYRGYYQALYKRYFNLPEIDAALKSDAYRTPTLKNYKFRFTNIVNPNTDLDALPSFRKISEMLNLQNILRCELASPEERLDLAFEITEEIVKNIIDSQDKKDSSKEKSKNESSKESGSDEESNEEFDDSDEKTEETPNEDSKQSSDKFEDIFGGIDSNSTQLNDDINEKNLSKDLSEKQLGKVDDIIKKQEEFVTRENKQSPFDADVIKKLKILEQSATQIVQVGNEEGIPQTNCIVVENMTKELMQTGDFPYTTKFKSDNGNLQNKNAIRDGIVFGSMLGRKLQIRAEIKTTKFTRLNSGKIDKRLLAAVGFQGENLFYQTSTDKYKNVHLHISVDASSSMGTKWKKTMTTLVAIAKAASMINNVTVCISFRSGINSNTNGSGEFPYIVMAYDSRKDKFSKITQLFHMLYPAGSTPEGLAFQAILKHIPMGTHELDSYFVNISDGEPAFGGGYHGEPAAKHTKKQVSKIREAGVSVISYFVESTDSIYTKTSNETTLFRTMYGKDAQFIDICSITQVAHTLNKKFLSKES